MENKAEKQSIEILKNISDEFSLRIPQNNNFYGQIAGWTDDCGLSKVAAEMVSIPKTSIPTKKRIRRQLSHTSSSQTQSNTQPIILSPDNYIKENKQKYGKIREYKPIFLEEAKESESRTINTISIRDKFTNYLPKPSSQSPKKNDLNLYKLIKSKQENFERRKPDYPFTDKKIMFTPQKRTLSSKQLFLKSNQVGSNKNAK